MGESLKLLNRLEEGLVLLEDVWKMFGRCLEGGWYRCWYGNGYVGCGKGKGSGESQVTLSCLKSFFVQCFIDQVYFYQHLLALCHHCCSSSSLSYVVFIAVIAVVHNHYCCHRCSHSSLSMIKSLSSVTYRHLDQSYNGAFVAHILVYLSLIDIQAY